MFATQMPPHMREGKNLRDFPMMEIHQQQQQKLLDCITN